MRGFLLDLAHAWRLLLKSPGFSFLAILCLGLGIGVNTSIFSLLNFLYLRPLPVHDPDRLLALSRGGNPLLSYPDYRDLRDRNQSLEGMAVSNPTESSLDFDGQSHAAGAEAVLLSYPRVIGVRTYLGRWFERDVEQTQSSASAPGSGCSTAIRTSSANGSAPRRNGIRLSASRHASSPVSTCR